ncbi:MAG: pyridoxamine 5'-phosphate oxidase family protein [Christensenellaceae bacterium]|jgi:hypothetical protein|nr:pyridoxamine 5'-phosphate oxidase family protein [Christensenellaceae bacterium]
MTEFQNKFDKECIEAFKPDSKIGLISTISPEGYPHVALISSIGAKDEETLIWGQFSQGLSKKYLATNTKTGWLVLFADMNWYTGKAEWQSVLRGGPEYDEYNSHPMFRYNSYFGIARVHYSRLVDSSKKQKLPMLGIGISSVQSVLIAKKLKAAPEGIIPEFTKKIANKIDGLEFIAYVDTDGYPRIFPALQGRPAGGNKLVFSTGLYPELCQGVPEGAKACIYLTGLDLAGQMLQGTFSLQKKGNKTTALIFNADKVYNPMLPVPGYIYPQEPLKATFGE